MKTQILTTIFLILFSTILSAQHIARVENIKIQSTSLNQERELLVYTPIDYDWRANEYFNVIYVFDSHSREFFDYTSAIISFLSGGSKSFIVVGVTSPYNEELDYSRNNDFLPVLQTKDAIERYGNYSGNADKFYDYVSTEVITYIDSHYRTLDNKIAIGHSLSASFVLDAFVKNPKLFNNYIAISPNMAYEDDKLADKLINFEYSKIEKPTYLYMSNADEGLNYWQEWKPAREKVYAFFNQQVKNDNLKVEIHEFTENGHWNAFPPSLNKALEFYFKSIYEVQEKELGEKEYTVTIKLKVLDKEDTIYITGNQDNLGNWNPEKIQMQKSSDYERDITLQLKSPAQFKFTKGTWDTEVLAKGTYGSVTIKPEAASEFKFEIEN